jgi:dynactin-2
LALIIVFGAEVIYLILSGFIWSLSVEKEHAMSGVRPTRDLEVFETPDLPSTSFNYEDDRSSEAVHSLDASMNTSFKKFKNTSLETKTADFSDSLCRPRQHGFVAEPSEYGLQSVAREPETLMERYQRLKTEVAELASDVEQVQQAQGDSRKMLGVSPVDLAQDVHLLQKQLHDVQMDQVMGAQHLTTPHSPYHSLLLRDLKSQVDALGSGDRGVVSGSHGDQPIYELYARTETAKFAHLSKLSEVEERLAQLEGVVGSTDTRVSSTAGGLDADQKDLSTAVLNLQAKVALLDPAHISGIGSQLQEVVSLLGQVEKKTEEGEKGDSDKQAKIAEALEAVNGIKSIAPLVPDLIARLHALRDLHERAAQFASSVALMSDSQDQLSRQTADLRTLLTKMETSFKENLATVQANFASLEARLTSVKS